MRISDWSSDVCSSDLDFPPATTPIQPGNQGAGMVEDPGDSSFAPGDRVMFGTFAYGFMRPGRWAEYVAVDAVDLAPIPASVPAGAAAQAEIGRASWRERVGRTCRSGWSPDTEK